MDSSSIVLESRYRSCSKSRRFTIHPEHCYHGRRSHKLAYQAQTCPHSLIATGLFVLPDCVPTASIFFTTSIPSTTFPKTTCFPSSQGVCAVQRKNWEPFVLGPAL